MEQAPWPTNDLTDSNEPTTSFIASARNACWFVASVTAVPMVSPTSLGATGVVWIACEDPTSVAEFALLSGMRAPSRLDAE